MTSIPTKLNNDFQLLNDFQPLIDLYKATCEEQGLSDTNQKALETLISQALHNKENYDKLQQVSTHLKESNLHQRERVFTILADPYADLPDYAQFVIPLVHRIIMGDRVETKKENVPPNAPRASASLLDVYDGLYSERQSPSHCRKALEESLETANEDPIHNRKLSEISDSMDEGDFSQQDSVFRRLADPFIHHLSPSPEKVQVRNHAIESAHRILSSKK